MLKFAVRERLPEDDPQAHAMLQHFAKRTRDRRRDAKAATNLRVDEIVTRLCVIPPSPAVVEETLRIWQAKDLPPFDEMILGAVIAKAAELHRAGEREMFFCNLNKSDFSPRDRGGIGVTKPNLEAEYARVGLTYEDSLKVPS